LKTAFLNDRDGSVVSKMTEDERGRFDAACQMLGDMFEYYLLIESDLKGSEWAARNDCWTAYVAIIYEQSAGFREYVKATEPEWTAVFLERLKKIAREKNLPSG
jgi:hypothetical protein